MLKIKFLCGLMFLLLTSLGSIQAQDINYPIETINGTEYYIYHAQSSEGLYAIGRKFGMKPDEIIEFNPELKENGVKANQRILIPVYRRKVKSTIIKESTTEITTNQSAVSTASDQINEPVINVAQALQRSKKMGEVNVALILPFLNSSGGNTTTSTARFIEFYEGLLLALENLKNQNISVNLFVYDAGDPSEELAPILNKPEMASIDMIIGPVSSEQIPVAADFAHRKKIPLILPSSSKSEDAIGNPYVFLVNVPKENLYVETANHFYEMFNTASITFLTLEGENKEDKAGLIAALKTKLRKHNIAYKEITKSEETLPELEGELSHDNENVVIPTSGSNRVLRTMLPALRTISDKDSIVSTKITLFGFPEWQMEKEYLDQYHALNTFIYSSFYDNVFSGESINFGKRFQSWYSKEVLQSYPKYSMLGYDTGLFFIKASHLFGSKSIRQIASYRLKSIQTGFNFKKASETGGYINQNVYFVNFRPDYTIQKIDFNE